MFRSDRLLSVFHGPLSQWIFLFFGLGWVGLQLYQVISGRDIFAMHHISSLLWIQTHWLRAGTETCISFKRICYSRSAFWLASSSRAHQRTEAHLCAPFRARAAARSSSSVLVNLDYDSLKTGDTDSSGPSVSISAWEWRSRMMQTPSTRLIQGYELPRSATQRQSQLDTPDLFIAMKSDTF